MRPNRDCARRASKQLARRALRSGALVVLVTLCAVTASPRVPDELRLAASTDPSVEQRVLQVQPHGLSPQAPTVSYPFTLPAGASQGSDKWYVFDFRVRITWSGQPGAAGISAATNRRVANQIEVESDGRSQRIFYAGVITGSVKRFTEAEVSTVIAYRNYGQDSAVHEGANEVEIKLETYSGAPVASVAILPGTALYETNVHPYQNAVELNVERVSVEAGRTFELRYVIKRRGQAPERPVSVDANIRSPILEVVGTAEHKYERIGSEVSGVFRLRGNRPGVVPVLVTLRNGADDPADAVTVTVTPNQREVRIREWVEVLSLGLVILIAGDAWRRHRSRIEEAEADPL
jgi:hypothetical protein